MSKPQVSIVTPFYNAARFFPETIHSVRGQTFRDWEWLMVDDGSSDGSLAIARDAAAADDRIRVLQHPGGGNRGQAASRNLAIAHARGDFYAFIDSDDIWIAEKLERDLATFRQHPEARLIYSRMIIWFSWSGRAADASRDYPGNLGVPCDRLIEPPTLFIHFVRNLHSYQSQYPAPSCLVLRRDAQPQGETLFEDSLHYQEDAAPIARVLLRHPAVVCDDVRTYHRRGGPSFTSNLTSKQLDASFSYIMSWIENYVRSAGVAKKGAVLEALAEARRAAEAKPEHRLRPALRKLIRLGRAAMPGARPAEVSETSGSRRWFWRTR